jgi:hypothetical protein
VCEEIRVLAAVFADELNGTRMVRHHLRCKSVKDLPETLKQL